MIHLAAKGTEFEVLDPYLEGPTALAVSKDDAITTTDYDINILDRKNQYEVVFESENFSFFIVGMSDIIPYPNTLYHNMTDEMFGQWKKEFLKQLNLAKNNFNPDVILTHHLWILSSMAREVFPDKKVVAENIHSQTRLSKNNIVGLIFRGFERSCD